MSVKKALSDQQPATRKPDLRKLWADIESSIDRTNRAVFCERWGAEREAFYKKHGTIPLTDIHKSRLRSVQNKYKGQRIFIVGNGPSINYMPLHLLKNEFTFGVNRIYLLYDRIVWKPTFYTANDWRVVPDVADEINALTGSEMFFFDSRFEGLLRDGSDVYWYEQRGAPQSSTPAERGFSTDLSTGLRGAGSVVGAAIQIAFNLGFDPIYLIGCDLGYKVQDTVLQTGVDAFGNGVKLHLTSTKDDDINHFDPRYFGTGRRWHDPNVKRMIEGHVQCRVGAEAAGRSIFNATLGGELEVYERVDFTSLFRNSRATTETQSSLNVISVGDRTRVGPFDRESALALDEAFVVKLLADQFLSQVKRPTMVDVGAHHGSSLAAFASDGWKVLAFEPDPKNRLILEGYIVGIENADVTIVAAAVNEIPGVDVPFFSSDESSKISGLSAFRGSHKQIAAVEVVRLDQKMAEIGVTDVNFLKVDVEGFELGVLRSFPWDACKPEFVLAEYEDGRTIRNGYTTATMYRFLEAKGYEIYICEWYPIDSYRRPQRFKAFYRLVDNRVPTASWGNILAIRRDVDALLEKEFLASCVLKAIFKALGSEKAVDVSSAAAGFMEPSTPHVSPHAPPRTIVPAATTSAATPKANLPAPFKMKPPMLPARSGGKVISWRKSWPFELEGYKFDLDFTIDGGPDTAVFDGSSPLMPFVIGDLAGQVLSSGDFCIVMGVETIIKHPGPMPRRYSLVGLADREQVSVTLNGVPIYNGPRRTSTNFASVGMGHRERGFNGRFHKAEVTLSAAGKELSFNDGVVDER